MQSSIKEIIKGSIVGIIGKVIGAGLNFFSLPILLLMYGKPGTGLVGVALSANAFMQIMNMGVPTGAVKNFSEWIEAKNFLSLMRGMQTNQFFFTTIGFINSLILVYIGYNASKFFSVGHPEVLTQLIYVLAATSFFNWYFMGFQHLLLAYEKIGWVNFSTSLINILNFLAVAVAYWMKASVTMYFFLYSMTNLIVVPINIIVAQKYGYLRRAYFLPILRVKEFKIIISYSMGLFGMGIIQYMANQAQPLILGTMAGKGDTAVADYRILQNVTMLVSLMSSIFLTNFLPYLSKINYRGDSEQINKFVFTSTKWLSVFIFYLCFLVAFDSDRILHMYVGKQANGLATWLTIWSLGMLFMNNQGISSLMLGIGKFRSIIIGLSIASAATIIFSVVFVKQIGVGVTAIGFLIYKVLEAIFIYGYYLPRIGKISSISLIKKSIIWPLLISAASVAVIKLPFNYLYIKNNFAYLSVISLLSFALYGYLVWIFIIGDSEKGMIKKSIAMVQGKLSNNVS